MKEMSFFQWAVVIWLLIGNLGIIIICSLGIHDLHRRVGRWPWEKR